MRGVHHQQHGAAIGETLQLVEVDPVGGLTPEMKRLKNGPEMVSAKFVIPYPPGFPIMVPGQVITHETITFMRKLDVKEIHGYNASLGLECLKPAALAALKKEATPKRERER